MADPVAAALDARAWQEAFRVMAALRIRPLSLAGYPLPSVTLALLIASGAFMLPYVTDPYFWLIKRSTGASMRQMVRGYTLPLSLLGVASFLLAALSSLIWPQI